MKITKLGRFVLSGPEAGRSIESKVIYDDDPKESFGFPRRNEAWE